MNAVQAPLAPHIRLLGRFEGVSFLLLLGVAMPLKYWAGLPLAVRWVGLAHGLLFIGYGMAVFAALAAGRFSRRMAAEAMVAALLPFGPFVFEARHAREGSTRGE